MKNLLQTLSMVLAALFLIGCSEPLTTREKGAAIGLVGGALIGDQMQARQQQEAAVQQQMQMQQQQINQQQMELNQLKAQQSQQER